MPEASCDEMLGPDGLIAFSTTGDGQHDRIEALGRLNVCRHVGCDLAFSKSIAFLPFSVASWRMSFPHRSRQRLAAR